MIKKRKNTTGGGHSKDNNLPSGAAGGGPESKPGSAVDKKQLRAQEKAARAAEKAADRAVRAEARKKALGKFKLVLSIVLVVLALLVAGGTVGGYFITKSDVNLPNVYVDGIDVGGLSQLETATLLEQHDWDESASIALRVKLPAGVSFKLDMCKSGAMLTKDGAVAAAYRYGHSSNWLENLFLYLGNLIVPVDVSQTNMRLDNEYIRTCAQAGIEKFQNKTQDKGYTVDTKQELLRMVKGAGQMEIDLDNLCSQIEAALLDGQRLLEHTNIDNTLSMPDFNKLYEELAVEPQDAYFEETSFEIVPEVVGCSFDVEQAESIWNSAQPGETIRIPLEITYPEKTAEYLESLLFRDKLGSQVTYYTWSSDNRINNINLAAAALDGLVLMPGQVFSYNETVGQRTTEAGYLPAGAYSDGQVVQEVGGGICQVSSTLYCAVMLSQLETVSRTSHYFPVDYLGWGLDATVSWPSPDYKFKNSRNYPVRLSAYCDNQGKTLTIEVWGTDEDGSYVELWHSMGVIYDDEYTDVVVGYGVSLYRSVYDKDGNFLYQVQEPYGIYNLHDEDIKWPESSQPDSPDYEGDSPINTPDPGGGDSGGSSGVIVPA